MNSGEKKPRVGEVGFQGVWSDFRLPPATLMRKVIEGQFKIVGRDKWGRILYEVLEA